MLNHNKTLIFFSYIKSNLDLSCILQWFGWYFCYLLAFQSLWFCMVSTIEAKLVFANAQTKWLGRQLLSLDQLQVNFYLFYLFNVCVCVHDPAELIKQFWEVSQPTAQSVLLHPVSYSKMNQMLCLWHQSSVYKQIISNI